MEERMNRFGEEVRILRSKRILRTRDDYVKAFGLNVDGCKVFPNQEEEGIYIKCPLSGGGWQVYKAILITENAFEGLYVFYPSWIDYRPYLERWKKKHHWKTMTLSEVQEARKKVLMESIDDSEQREFFVFCAVLYAITFLVSPALIVTAVLTHDSSLALGNTWICAMASGILLLSADLGPRPNSIIGIIALIECPVSLAFFVMILVGLI
jgi:hypothetical protein